MAEKEYLERTMEQTPTWAIAVVCFVLLAISILIEQGIHHIGAWLKSKHKRALFEALEKIKAELMLLGFLSLLLVILKRPIASICISKKAGDSWHPCSKDPEYEAKTKEEDKCMKVDKVALVSSYAIYQLHKFIFVLAVFHVLYCITTLALGRTKIMKWKAWEDETKTMEYQYSHDPQRFRFARETSFGRRHLNSWSRSSVLLWIVSFFRQFFKSVDKVDYLALRHGFIVAHLAPGSETNFDFLKYISRSLEEDFVVVVGISPTIWFSAVLFLLSNTRGWYAYFWLPFIPLIIILLVGAKLVVIITKMGLRIHERGDVVRGTPVVELGDDLFWFNNPRFILFLINLVLFQNAFQLAFFAWSTYEFGLRTCFHQHLEDIIIRISMGVIIHFLCSYVTLPLYALVTQMGSTMKPTIFNDGVATALKHWHHTAKEHTKHHHGGQRSEGGTPCSSAPTTPTHSMSPVHLLHNYRRSDSLLTSPKKSNFVNAHWDDEGSTNRFHHGGMDNEQYNGQSEPKEEAPQTRVPAGSAQLPPGPRPTRAQHEIDINSSEFSFRKRDHRLDRTG